jgi:hypothetical protein
MHRDPMQTKLVPKFGVPECSLIEMGIYSREQYDEFLTALETEKKSVKWNKKVLYFTDKKISIGEDEHGTNILLKRGKRIIHVENAYQVISDYYQQYLRTTENPNKPGFREFLCQEVFVSTCRLLSDTVVFENLQSDCMPRDDDNSNHSVRNSFGCIECKNYAMITHARCRILHFISDSFQR